MSRKFYALFLWVLLFLSASTTLAQDPCEGLSDYDCDLRQRAAESLLMLSSATYNFDMNLSMDMGFMPLDFAMRGRGTFVLDESLAPLSNPDSPLYDNPTDFFTTVFSGINLNADMTLILPELVTEMSETDMPSELAMSMRLVEGYAYINMDDFLALSAENTMPMGWYGMDLVGLLVAMANDPDYRETFDLDAFRPNAAPIETDTGFDATYVQQERLSNITIDGQTVAVYRTTIQMAGVLEDTATRVALRLAFRDALQGTVREANMEAAIDAYLLLIQDMTFSYTEAIGTRDAFVYNIGFEIMWQPTQESRDAMQEVNDPLGLALFTGGLEITFNLDIRQHNRAPKAKQPAGATIIPLSALIPEM